MEEESIPRSVDNTMDTTYRLFTYRENEQPTEVPCSVEIFDNTSVAPCPRKTSQNNEREFSNTEQAYRLWSKIVIKTACRK